LTDVPKLVNSSACSVAYALDKTLNAFLYGLCTSMKLVFLKDNATANCRVKRHLMTTTSHEHEASTEIKPG